MNRRMTLSAASWLVAAAMLIPARPGSAAPRVPAGSQVRTDALAKRLAGPAASRPLLVQVGFRVLYRGGHIPGSRYAGPGSRPEGLRALRDTLARVPRSTPIVLYCGCCPWTDCPNVEPAFTTARSMGFKAVQVLFVPKSLQADWIDKRLPTASGAR